MSRKNTDGRKRGGGGGEDDDVETLLRAAEDELLLNLSTDSHVARGASHSSLDPDLHRRFQALKSPNPPPRQRPQEKNPAGTDDPFARFAALKGPVTVPCDNDVDDDDGEVAKIMRWAIDSARLDPSPESDVDDDVDCSTDDEEDESHRRRGKEKKKKKNGK